MAHPMGQSVGSGEHSRCEALDLPQRLATEEEEADAVEMESGYDAQDSRLRQLLERWAEPHVCAKEQAVVSPQDHEIPTRSMPDAIEEKREKEGDVDALRSEEERLIDIIAEPARKRDMPTPPEVDRIAREVGQVE